VHVGTFPYANVGKADHKRRLRIKGLKSGTQYLVTEQEDGWWITPSPDVKPPRRRFNREWKGTGKSLAELLRPLQELGLEVEVSPSGKEKVGPCPF
jgi:hypothetical protein